MLAANVLHTGAVLYVSIASCGTNILPANLVEPTKVPSSTVGGVVAESVNVHFRSFVAQRVLADRRAICAYVDRDYVAVIKRFFADCHSVGHSDRHYRFVGVERKRQNLLHTVEHELRRRVCRYGIRRFAVVARKHAVLQLERRTVGGDGNYYVLIRRRRSARNQRNIGQARFELFGYRYIRAVAHVRDESAVRRQVPIVYFDRILDGFGVGLHAIIVVARIIQVRVARGIKARAP